MSIAHQGIFKAIFSNESSSSILSCFSKFIRRIVPYKNKNKTIVNYETQLTRYLEHGGIHCDVIFPSKTMYDPTLFHWRTLLDDGFPF